MDKKFIRDLNSLIKIDKRKRLKAPAARPAILGGVGIGTGSVYTPPPNPDLMYVIHKSASSTNKNVYGYHNLDAPVLIQSDIHVSCISIGVYAGELYYAEDNGSGTVTIKRDGEFLFSRAYDDDGMTGESGFNISVTSANIVLYNTDNNSPNNHFYFYDHAGNYLSTITTSTGTAIGDGRHAANTKALSVHYFGDGFSYPSTQVLSNAGASLSITAGAEYDVDLVRAASKSVHATITTDASRSTYNVKLWNNSGTYIGSYALTGLKALMGCTTSNYCVGDIGITDTRLYIVGNYASDEVVAVYEHSLTMTGSLATGGTLGSYLGLVSMPVDSSGILGAGNIDTACDAITFVE